MNKKNTLSVKLDHQLLTHSLSVKLDHRLLTRFLSEQHSFIFDLLLHHHTDHWSSSSWTSKSHFIHNYVVECKYPGEVKYIFSSLHKYSYCYQCKWLIHSWWNLRITSLVFCCSFWLCRQGKQALEKDLAFFNKIDTFSTWAILFFFWNWTFSDQTTFLKPACLCHELTMYIIIQQSTWLLYDNILVSFDQIGCHYSFNVAVSITTLVELVGTSCIWE